MQKIVPAILAANSEELRSQLAVLKNHTKWLHIDIADGKFVPNTTVSLHELGEAYEFFNLEIHLMVADPSKYFEDCGGIGAKRVIFHYEATDNIGAVLEAGQKHPFQKGLAVNPETGLSAVQSYFDKLDSILLMSIHPGFQGQEFIPESLEKIQTFKNAPNCPVLAVDGGVGSENILSVFNAGVDYVAVGSAIVKQEDPVGAFQELSRLLE